MNVGRECERERNSPLSMEVENVNVRGTLLWVFRECERDSKLQKEMHFPLKATPKGRLSSLLTFLFIGQVAGGGRLNSDTFSISGNCSTQSRCLRRSCLT